MKLLSPGYSLLLAGLFLISCGASKKSAGTRDRTLNRSSQYVVKKLAAQQHLDVADFNGRAKIKYDDGHQKISFVTQLRMKRGAYIWITASFLSYEVARILIRPDSIFAINRLEKNYLAESYGNFNSSYEIPASYSQLEAMLLGNSVVDFKLPFDFGTSKGTYQFTQHVQDVGIEEWIDPVRFAPSEVSVQEEKSGYAIRANYQDYRKGLDSKDFSYFRQYIINKDNAQVASIQIQFTNIDTNSKAAPFEIPEHYQRTD